MSLYGALYAGVSGLNAQSSNLGVISNNISNANTVGYKGDSAAFQTLVTGSGGASSFAPGGVLAGNRQLITQQGLLQTTSSSTDIAVTGNGFFVTNQTIAGDGQVMYTRAGSFSQDSQGNFRNAAGLYLQGWPLDSNGLLPGAPGNLNTTSSANLTSLRTINVTNATGNAADTNLVTIGANLNAGQIAYAGASGEADMDTLDTLNATIAAKDIIVPSTVNSTQRGDKFTVTSGAGISYSYQYGGFTFGRNVTSGANGDSGLAVLSSPTTLGGTPFNTNTGFPNTVTVTQNAHGLKTGDTVTFSGVAANFNGISASELNSTKYIVTVLTANTYTITTTSSATANGNGGTGTIQADTRPFIGNIFDASNATQTFLSATGVTGFTSAARSFTMNTPATGTVTFTYTTASPNAQLGQFNNLNNLATAINSVNGLSARVVNGRLYAGATDANAAVTFANVQDTGSPGSPVLSGLDWVRELGLTNIVAGSNRYSTLQGLADLVNASPGLTGSVINPLSDATVKININDPLDTITFADRPVSAALPALTNTTPFTTTNGSRSVQIQMDTQHGFQVGDIVTLNPSGMAAAGPFNGIPKSDFNGQFVITQVNSGTTFTIQVATAATASGPLGGTGLVVTPPNNSGSVLAMLGMVSSLNGALFTPQTTGALGPSYDSTDPAKNMASGTIPPQFSRPISVYDALGTAHNLNTAFLKTGENSWSVEIYALPASEVSASYPDGQVATGTLTFNGDGSLRSISSSLSQAININWTNGAAASAINFNWGTAGQPFGTPNASVIGKTDGMSQFNSSYNVTSVKQNGAPVGQLTSVAIDKEGFVIASYNNGETQSLFKIPLAEFADANQLATISGNAFLKTSSSGEVNLREAGTSGVGAISSNALEASNVELASQLTDMIVAQRAYQANTKVISTADALLEALNQILR